MQLMHSSQSILKYCLLDGERPTKTQYEHQAPYVQITAPH